MKLNLSVKPLCFGVVPCFANVCVAEGIADRNDGTKRFGRVGKDRRLGRMRLPLDDKAARRRVISLLLPAMIQTFRFECVGAWQ